MSSDRVKLCISVGCLTVELTAFVARYLHDAYLFRYNLYLFVSTLMPWLFVGHSCIHGMHRAMYAFAEE